jgi:cellulose synthase/poly-beta-1,6-N-acetylglucosamine synthase-like glycosyltransferase
VETNIWIHWLYYAGTAGWVLFSVTAIIVLLRYRFSAQKPTSGSGVSVVIAARNEAENLRAHLPKILRQHHSPMEVIVVNDRSDDGSADFLTLLQSRHRNLRVVHIASTPPGFDAKKHALIVGAEAAVYDILLFTDADCMPDSEKWVETMAAPFGNANTEVVLGYSQYVQRRGLLNCFVRFETLTTGLTYTTLTLAGIPYMGVGRNIAYRRERFLYGPGYGLHSHVTGGDDDLMVQRLSNKDNTTMCLHAHAVVYSIPEGSVKCYWRQKIRHLSTGLRYRTGHKAILALLIGSKLVFWTAGMAAILSGSATGGMAAAFILAHFFSLAAILLLKIKTADRTDIWTIPLLELLFIIYYISAGLAVLGTKEIRWN